MIRLSKERPQDTELLVFDVRSKAIALERGTEPKVFLGRIIPDGEDTWRWESRWGFNCGREANVEAAQMMIEKCAKGQYV